MNILAIDFSSNHRGLAVLSGGRVVGELRREGARGPAPLALVAELLKEVGWEAGDVDSMAIGLGPGSHTGVRSAIALAQGWQAARGTPSRGVLSVEAMAWGAWRAGLRGGLHLVVDAQQRQVYHVCFQLGEHGPTQTSDLEITNPSAIVPGVGERLAGPEIRRWFPEGIELFPSAVELGMVAEGLGFEVAAERLEPVHLREVAFVKAPAPRIIM